MPMIPLAYFTDYPTLLQWIETLFIFIKNPKCSVEMFDFGHAHIMCECGIVTLPAVPSSMTWMEHNAQQFWKLPQDPWACIGSNPGDVLRTPNLVMTHDYPSKSPAIITRRPVRRNILDLLSIQIISSFWPSLQLFISKYALELVRKN